MFKGKFELCPTTPLPRALPKVPPLHLRRMRSEAELLAVPGSRGPLPIAAMPLGMGTTASFW